MRYLVLIGLVVVLAGGLGIIKLSQRSAIATAGAAAMKGGPPPEVVGTAVATEAEWEDTLPAVGTVAAVRGVAVSNEVAGVVKAIRFESGQVVRAGQVLVELDASVEKAQLASAEARKELAAAGAGRTRKLAAGEMVAQAQVDTDEAQLKSSTAEYSVLQAQIEKKTIRAPFAGKLGIRAVNLGQYLQPGTTITVLESLGSVYVDFTLPQQELPTVKIGTPLKVTLADAGGLTFDGTVAAIDPTVDAASRTLKLRAQVPNPGERLRPGMFVQVVVTTAEKRKVIIAPATAVVYASYGNSVFVVETKPGPDGQPAKVARQQFVRLGPARGDFVALTAGIEAGQELVTSGAFKLRNGARVVVNNQIGPTPALQPKVENL